MTFARPIPHCLIMLTLAACPAAAQPVRGQAGSAGNSSFAPAVPGGETQPPEAPPAQHRYLEFTRQRHPGETQPQETPPTQLQVFRLKYAHSAAATDLLKQIFKGQRVTVALDESTNSVLVHGSPVSIAEIAGMLEKLDVPPPARAAADIGSSVGGGPNALNPAQQGRQPSPEELMQTLLAGSGRRSGSSSSEDRSAAKIQALRGDYEGLERKAALLADQHRHRGVSIPALGLNPEDLLSELRSVVFAAFAARQELQRAELALLRQRMTHIEQSVAAREQLKNKIVEQRVQELLKSELRWEPAAASSGDAVPGERGPSPLSGMPAAEGSETGASPAPFGLEGYCPVHLSERAVLAPGDRRFRVKHRGTVYLFDSQACQNKFLADPDRYRPAVSGDDRDPFRTGANRAPAAAAQGLSWPSTAPSGTVILRSADEFSRKLQEAEANVEHVGNTKLWRNIDPKAVEAARRQLQSLRDEYQAQLRLLQLELEAAKSSFTAETRLLSNRTALNYVGAAGGSEIELDRQKLAEGQARLRLQQLETLYELYRKVGQPAEEAPAAPVTFRQQSVNNLQALLLALHEYHDQHARFPPAVILGKDGKGTVPHSWRVELLPRLGQQALYDQYRFDEPWDSAHNKQLLSKMPAVFRSPRDAADSTHASYFGVVWPTRARSLPGGGEGGEGAAGGQIGDGEHVPAYSTVFSRPKGARMLEILDGTRNTISLVEAQRVIHWTEPRDIVWFPSPEEPPPPLGGWFPEGFHAGFADGTVQFLSSANDPATLRALFTIAGDESVKPKLVDEPVR